jgi:hypothetical protein
MILRMRIACSDMALGGRVYLRHLARGERTEIAISGSMAAQPTSSEFRCNFAGTTFKLGRIRDSVAFA